MSVHFQPFGSGPMCEAGTIAALQSLRECHAALAESAMVILGSGWELERRHSCDGHLLLVISRLPASSEIEEICFVLHGSARGVHLDAIEQDNYHILGRFDGVQGAIRAIASRMDFAHATPVAPEAA